MSTIKSRRIVHTWLWIGLFMVFMQIIIGGITRLTGSGLSITKWEIVTGTLPPLTAAKWQSEFDLYKATPQYQKINKGMTMGEFKFIYFWEYLHRVWARSMGFIFLFPFSYFLYKGWIDRDLRNRLLITVGIAAIVATFGWIMVASGLVDRPWVNAYKLTWHLSLALILYGYLFYTIYKSVFASLIPIVNRSLKHWLIVIMVILAIQILLGGMMSGMRAALSYPTWPDMNGTFIPSILTNSAEWNMENFVDYDKGGFMAALVQFFHRAVAYILTIMIIVFYFKFNGAFENRLLNNFRHSLLVVLLVQVLLGILTVIKSKAIIPVSWGIYHQGLAIILLTLVLMLLFSIRKK